MKVGIITYHFPYNSGAALQCLALQTTLQQMGHDVSVINYRPWYHQNRYTPNKNIFYAASEATRTVKEKHLFRRSCVYFKALMKAIMFNLVKSKKFRISEEKFSTFTNTHLVQTKVFRTNMELEKKLPHFDVIFSGSDQLWNTELTGGKFDPAYFITFASPETTRATFAIGANFADDVKTVRDFEQLIADLDAISLRESKYMRIVRRVRSQNTILTQCIDPTLLLKRYDYERFEADEKHLAKSEYILVYTMGDKFQGKVYAAAKKLSEKTGLPVLDITGNPSRGEKVFGVDSVKAGPDEFLTYVKNAKYVLANSFHGTAFSVIYQKQFMIIPHSRTGNRVTDLLSLLGINERWCNTPDECVEKIDAVIDYASVEEKLSVLRNDARSYINTVIE